MRLSYDQSNVIWGIVNYDFIQSLAMQEAKELGVDYQTYDKDDHLRIWSEVLERNPDLCDWWLSIYEKDRCSILEFWSRDEEMINYG